MRGSRLLFLHNPRDPFVDASEIRMADELASGAGLRTAEQLVDIEHVKAMFSMPKKVFAFLRDDVPAAGAPAHPTPDHEMIRRMVLEGRVEAADSS